MVLCGGNVKLLGEVFIYFTPTVEKGDQTKIQGQVEDSQNTFTNRKTLALDFSPQPFRSEC